MFCMSTYVKLLKTASKNKRISNEEFVRTLFDTVVLTVNVTNQKNKPLDLDKSRISRILSQKDDVPSALKDTLMDNDIEEKVRNPFEKFIKEFLCQEEVGEVSDKIMGVITADPELSDEIKQHLSQSLPQSMTFLLRAFLEAIRINNISVAHNDSLIWSKGANSIRVISGDLFKYGFGNRNKGKNIVVIPVNTSFETHVSISSECDPFPLVSETTIHGKWLNRFVQSGGSIRDLDKRISDTLERHREQPSGQSPSQTAKPERYPIGTIAVIEEKTAVYYLLAVSNFDEDNVARSSTEELEAAIANLLLFYDRHGKGLNLYLPLIGTGRSRCSLTNRQSVDLITNTFLKNENHIQGNVFIVILPEIYPTINIKHKTEERV